MLENNLLFGFRFGLGLSRDVPNRTGGLGGLSPQSNRLWRIILVRFVDRPCEAVSICRY